MDPFRPLLRLLEPLRARPGFRRLRATLILLHFVAVAAVACPAPVRTISASTWKRAAVRDELEGWSRRLGVVGVTASTEQIKDFTVTLQREWTDARNAVVWPFQGWLRAVGAPQGWYMFTGPDREPQRFALGFTTDVDGGHGVAEERVFELGYHLDHPEIVLPDFLDDHRIRRAMFQSSWGRSENTFRLVCAALNDRVRAARPDAVEVRCRLISRPVEHPYRRDRVRTDTVTRAYTIFADGSTIESRDGVEGKRRPPRPDQRTGRGAHGLKARP